MSGELLGRSRGWWIAFRLKRIAWSLLGILTSILLLATVYLLPVAALACLLGIRWALAALVSLVAAFLILQRMPDVLEWLWHAIHADCPVHPEQDAK